MSSIIASRSGQLARPGAHLDELEETVTAAPEAFEHMTPTTLSELSGRADAPDDVSAREIRWVCEWWPPT